MPRCVLPLLLLALAGAAPLAAAQDDDLLHPAVADPQPYVEATRLRARTFKVFDPALRQVLRPILSAVLREGLSPIPGASDLESLLLREGVFPAYAELLGMEPGGQAIARAYTSQVRELAKGLRAVLLARNKRNGMSRLMMRVGAMRRAGFTDPEPLVNYVLSYVRMGELPSGGNASGPNTAYFDSTREFAHPRPSSWERLVGNTCVSVLF